MAQPSLESLGFVADSAQQNQGNLESLGFQPDQSNSPSLLHSLLTRNLGAVSNIANPSGVNPLPLPGVGALEPVAQDLGIGVLKDIPGVMKFFNPSGAASLNAKLSAQAPTEYSPMENQLLQSTGQYLPYMVPEAGVARLGASLMPELAAKMAASAGIGGAFGATQTASPLIGGAIGAGSNLALSGLGALVSSPIANVAHGYLAKYSAPGLIRNIGDALEGVKQASNQNAFNLAKQNYDQHTLNEKAAWNNLKTIAQQVDSVPKYRGYYEGQAENDISQSGGTGPSPSAASPPPSNLNTIQAPLSFPRANNLSLPIGANIGPTVSGGLNQERTLSSQQLPMFDDTDYKSALSNQLSKLQGQSNRQSGMQRANQDSESLLQDYINDQHSTFADAIEHNQALNRDYENELTPGKSLPFSTINFAKGQLKNAIQSNIEDNGLQDTLGAAWNAANKATADKQSIFNQITNQKGKANVSTFATINNLKNQFADPTTFVNDYLPKSRGDGIQSMQQFGQMLGNEDTAKNVLKSNYFDKSFTSDGISPKKFLTRYNNLSPDQQDYLFDGESNNYIQALNKINENHPDALSHSIYSSLGHHGVAATLGGILGISTGHGLWEGLGAGIAGGVAANAALRHALSTPKMTDYFANYLNNPSAHSDLSGISQRIQGLSPFISPQLANLFGGQQ